MSIVAERLEAMVVAMAAEVADGQLWAQGIATPMVAAALALAKRTHAPGAHFAYAIGCALAAESGQISITSAERTTLGHATRIFSFGEGSAELLPHLVPYEMLRPAQVDSTGATNNVCLGPYAHPKVRLPGVGGISDVSVFNPNLYLYVPRHTAKVFVPRLDFLSGIGHGPPAPGVVGPGPRKVFSDLGVFGFEGPRMSVLALHPGVGREEVVAATGFELVWPREIGRTLSPDDGQRRLLAQIDPLGLRHLEAMGLQERLLHLAELLAAHPEA